MSIVPPTSNSWGPPPLPPAQPTSMQEQFDSMQAAQPSRRGQKRARIYKEEALRQKSQKCSPEEKEINRRKVSLYNRTIEYLNDPLNIEDSSLLIDDLRTEMNRFNEPKDVRSINALLAYALFKSGRLDEASKRFLQLVDVQTAQPRDTDMLLKIAHCYEARKSWPQMLRYADTASRLNGNKNFEALRLRETALLQLGKISQVIQDLVWRCDVYEEYLDDAEMQRREAFDLLALNEQTERTNT